jgi:hypothetical protein
MKKTLIALAAGALLAGGFSAPVGAAESVFKIKSGTSAQDAGKCLATNLLWTKLSKEVLKKESPENDQITQLWTDYITAGDSAFIETATKSMVDTSGRYSAAAEKSSDDMLSAVVGDLADCLGALQ